MFWRQFPLLVVLGLLMLTLFDSNPWWKVALYAAPAALLTGSLSAAAGRNNLSPAFTAALQGLAAGLFAFLLGFTPWFRTTWGTLLGFAFLVTLAELILVRLLPSPGS
ncbi:MAG TPA: hypothetical protein GX393_06100 [Firmicutes bacterium]|jgi:hypothetical protein|nr:hypothetical protein [Bacillota bacterium]